jgi:uncharacterized membrane protein YphA (DoxX/SURF4 family)
MTGQLHQIIQRTRQATPLIIRIVLFLTFFGHGLVNLGLSPTYTLHINLIEAVNFTSLEPETITYFLAGLDFLFAFTILFKLGLRKIIQLSILYLILVGMAGWMLYYQKAQSVFGIAENMRRLPWVFFLLYLFWYSQKQVHKYHWIRIGIAFAFLAHGTASLGLLGLRAGHIELAANVIPDPYVRDFIFYTGVSDTIIGTLLLTGLLSRIMAWIGSCYLVGVVIISLMVAIPDGIFRAGFLVAALYTGLDKRCHNYNILTWLGLQKPVPPS